MTSIEGTDKARKGVTRPQLIAVLAVAMFALSAMLRQYREITIPVTVVLAAWAVYAYFRETRGA